MQTADADPAICACTCTHTTQMPTLAATRPTAVDLVNALNEVRAAMVAGQTTSQKQKKLKSLMTEPKVIQAWQMLGFGQKCQLQVKKMFGSCFLTMSKAIQFKPLENLERTIEQFL